MELILNLHFEQGSKTTKFIQYFSYFIYFNVYNKNLSRYCKIIRKYFILEFISHN